MAQYIEKKNGWGVRFYSDELDGHGKKKRVYLSGFSTQKKAEKAMIQYLKDLESQKMGIKDIGFTDFMEYWYDNFVLIYCQRTTQVRYQGIILRQLLPEFKNKPITDITPLEIQEFYKYKLLSYSPATVEKYHVVLSSAFAKAVKWGYLMHNTLDMVDPPRGRKKEKEIPELNVMRDILQDVKENRPNAYKICMFLAYTGARRGEACGLQDTDINLENRTVLIKNNYVRAGSELILKPFPKNTKKRTIHLFEDIIPLLERNELEKKQNRLKFGKHYVNNNFYFTWNDGRPYDPDYIYKSFKLSCKRLGYEDLTLHDLRHFYASIMISRGDIPIKVIQDSLGHSTAEMMDLYGHLMNDMAKKVFKGKKLGLLENA